VEAGLIQRRGGIESRHLRHGNQQISAAAAKVQRQRGGAPGSRLGVIEVGVRGAAVDVVKDGSPQAAREHISGTVGDTADIQGPEAHSHDQGMSSAGGLRQRQGDRSAGSRLTAEGGFLDQRNCGRWWRRLGCSTGWTGLGTLAGGIHGGGLVTVGRTIGEAAICMAGRGDWAGVELAISSAIHRAIEVITRGTGRSIPHEVYLSISGRGRESRGSGRRRWWLRCGTGWTGLGTLAGGIHGGGLVTIGRTIGEAAICIAGGGDWTGVELAISSAIHRAVEVVACSARRGVPS